MTDTHTHIYMTDAFPDGGVEAVNRALEAGVSRMVFPCVTMDSLPSMRNLHQHFPNETRLGIGLHPTEMGDNWETELDGMEAILADNPDEFVAIGETGVDLHWDKSHIKEQMIAFRRQLEWGHRYNKPVIVHCREAFDEALEVISDFMSENELPVMIFHSFTGVAADVEKIRKVCNPYFGINGVVTFKNAPELREAVKLIGLEKLVLETDAPWLAPVPKRGSQNESSNIPYIRDCIAGLFGIDSSEVERITDRNADIIFNFAGDK